MKKLSSLALLSCIILLSVSRLAHAEWIPPFNLDAWADRSPLIVEAVLNTTGELSEARAIKGILPTEPITLGVSGKHYVKNLAAAMKATGPMRAILFLDNGNDRNPDLFGHAGLVGLGNDGVYAFTSLGTSLPSQDGGYTKLPDHTPATFLQAVNKTLVAISERDRLLALPRSPGRTRLLLDLLIRQDSTYSMSPASPGRLPSTLQRLPIIARLFRNPKDGWYTIARAVHPAQPGDTKIVLQELHRLTLRNDVRAQALQVRLLTFLGDIDPGEAAFPEVARLIGRDVPSEIRTTAIRTLSSIDSYHATKLLAPMLSPDDPALWHLLLALSPANSSAQKGPLNDVAVAPLLRLSRQFRQPPLTFLAKDIQLGQHLIYQLHRLGHPILLPELYQWTKIQNVSIRQSAVDSLNNLTGLKLSPGGNGPVNTAATANDDLWNAWWQTFAPLLKADYDLRSESGRKAWFHAYNQADPAARRILIRLWSFENKINQPALIRAASADDEYSPAAKTLLSTLWQQKRLTPATRHAIVARFLRFTLVRRSGYLDRKQLVLNIVGLRDFPFPTDSPVEYGYSVAVGDEKLHLDSTPNSHSLEGSGPIVLATWRDNLRQGPPAARALVELREIDYYNPRETNKVQWSHRWTLDPLPITP